MKLCLCQGTFNPIHNAHLRIAKFALDNYAFDKVLFIPAYIPPQKNNFGSENAKHRLNMVNLAVENYPCFEVSDIEYRRNKPSYTFETVCELYKIYNLKEKPSFLIGTDAFINIETWYKTEKLKDLIDFKLFIRNKNFDEAPFLRLKAKGYFYELMELDFEDISSSEIRKKISKDEDVCDMIPLKVLEYIRKNGLYKI